MLYEYSPGNDETMRVLNWTFVFFIWYVKYCPILIQMCNKQVAWAPPDARERLFLNDDKGSDLIDSGSWFHSFAVERKNDRGKDAT